MTTLVVIAKACVPGRVKTRLHPPLTLAGAARVAAAALADTLEALGDAGPGAGSPGDTLVGRRVLYFDGSAADVPDEAAGYEVVPQAPGLLDARIGWLLDHVRGPLLLVGMDTPQVTVAHLAPALAGLAGAADEPDAWLGPAADGGYWALGLGAGARRGDLVRGVPMSRDDTGARQRERLERAGQRVRLLDELVDVDTVDDLRTVARAAPGGRVARAAEELGCLELAPEAAS
ncbi:TIGR04282 family arsenosugar biosynthesis glycosyltransferase [Luteimicrobium sp. DT211]|uniref:TIGR04282 family arsenosugar biosynthesis glycosyltransferase n=1 Tax=Luteimicrobium sp. DT211 TaxID=3393412 RepID=UPI003CF61AF3